MKLHIVLLSDAELGTGLGNEAIDDCVPRDASGEVCVPASHVRGLLRDRIQRISEARGWPRTLETMVLGEGGSPDTGGVGVLSSVQLRDATATIRDDDVPSVITITRTALTAAGTVKPTSLRTTEAICGGTRFETELRLSSPVGSLADKLVRLGLMSVEAIGANRTRGAGRCAILIEGEDRTPGQLLREIDAQAKSFEFHPVSLEAPEHRPLDEGESRWFRLVFRAQGPVCCPETPVNGSTNHIRSGPVIPSSAVQGALITKLDHVSPELATSCLHDGRFRAWPLIPVMPADARGAVPFGVRVDLTHRMSKLPDDRGAHLFKDAALEPYRWTDTGDSPLRSSDGILRVHGRGHVDLWRASELPRVITAHGVHHDPTGSRRRNLFSIEALAPMVFVGLVSMPPEAADGLSEALEHDDFAAFGRARRGGGSGRLSLKEVTLEEMFGEESGGQAQRQVFVVQSPLAIPDDFAADPGEPAWRAEKALAHVAAMAQWGRAILDRGEAETWRYDRTAATCGIRFGWNRHGIGRQASARHRRLRARRVVLPGSVLVLEAPLSDVGRRLQQGLGEGREQGYGALLPHPGLARELHRVEQQPETIGSKDLAGRLALELFKAAGRAKGPSPSQIGALGRELSQSPARAKRFIAQQRRRGAVKHWQRWQRVLERVETEIEQDAERAKRALKVWQDLAIIHRSDREGQ